MYLIIESAILRANNGVMGARFAIHSLSMWDPFANLNLGSIWVFLLLGMEAIRTYRSNPHLIIGTHQIPTWTTPLLLIIVVWALVPNTSLLGHLCGVAVGYIGSSCTRVFPHDHELTL